LASRRPDQTFNVRLRCEVAKETHATTQRKEGTTDDHP
jgi:hypothetical protein